MKVIQNTPDLLILRYRPISLAVFGACVAVLFSALSIFTLFQAAPIIALMLAAFTGIVVYALHKQDLMVGVYCDKTRETVAIYRQRFLSRQNAIYALSKVDRFDLQYQGLEERMILWLKDERYPLPLTRDYLRHNAVTPAATQANAWISAAR